MRLLLSVVIISNFILGLSGAAIARDCGEPPTASPRLPDGSRATAEEIRSARTTVLSYSQSVDTYLACMDEKAGQLFTYMTEEQRERWNDDLAGLHEERRTLQQNMNAQIRAFRDTQRTNSRN